VTLPPALQTGIDELTRRVTAQELGRSSRALSDAYRAGGSTASRAARTAGEVSAYLATRAPATYAAAEEVFGQIRVLRPDWAPASALDLGAGPGIATWAALEAWREIAAVTLVEAEPEMARAGKRLAEQGRDALRQASWAVAATRRATGAWSCETTGCWMAWSGDAAKTIGRRAPMRIIFIQFEVPGIN